MTEKISVLISEEEVVAKIKKVAEQINKDYAGRTVTLVGILKGSVFFMCELAKHLTIPVTLDFMSVSSYTGTESTGIVRIVKDLDEPLEGKDVIIVEDIIDTGNTLNYLKEVMKDRRANSIRMCTLLDKPARRERKNVIVDYCACSIPNEFVVGFGLDYDQKYRNLPFIGILEFEEEEPASGK